MENFLFCRKICIILDLKCKQEWSNDSPCQVLKITWNFISMCFSFYKLVEKLFVWMLHFQLLKPATQIQSELRLPWPNIESVCQALGVVLVIGGPDQDHLRIYDSGSNSSPVSPSAVFVYIAQVLPAENQSERSSVLSQVTK